jgi:predicted RNA-binding protein with EMAP domain
MSDTRNDYRILVAEHALGLLENIVRTRSIPGVIEWRKLEELIREARSLLMSIKYSFLPPRMLAEHEAVRKLQDLSKEISKILLPWDKLRTISLDKKAKMSIARAKYAIRILYGLPYRLILGDENDPLYAVDIECVKILSVTRHPNADKLYVTRAKGVLTYTIVTNIEGVKKDEIRAAAILPPVELRGEISEAMYCSDVIDEPSCVGKRPKQELIDRKEVEKIIYEIVRG